MTTPYANTQLTVRSAVSSNDGANPTVGTGKDFSGYKLVEVEVKLAGTTPGWSITPLLINPAGDAYMDGETLVVSGAKTQVFLLEVHGCPDVNFRCDTQSGSSPVVTHIKVRGLN